MRGKCSARFTAGAGVLWAILFGSPTAPAAYVHASANGYANAAGIYQNDTYDSGQVGGPSAAHSGGASKGTSSVSESARAEFGALHAYAATHSGGDGSYAVGNVQADFLDQIHVTSPTLPAGTAVQFQLDISLHYSLSSDDPRADPNKDVRAEWFLRGVGGPTASDFVHFIANEQWGAGPTPNTYTAIYNTAVGDTIQVTGSLLAKSQDAGLFAGSGPSNSVMDASNTSSLIFRPVTAGASYTTDSGATYVPEPTGLLLGLAAVLLKRNRARTDGLGSSRGRSGVKPAAAARP